MNAVEHSASIGIVFPARTSLWCASLTQCKHFRQHQTAANHPRKPPISLTRRYLASCGDFGCRMGLLRGSGRQRGAWPGARAEPQWRAWRPPATGGSRASPWGRGAGGEPGAGGGGGGGGVCRGPSGGGASWRGGGAGGGGSRPCTALYGAARDAEGPGAVFSLAGIAVIHLSIFPCNLSLSLSLPAPGLTSQAGWNRCKIELFQSILLYSLLLYRILSILSYPTLSYPILSIHQSIAILVLYATRSAARICQGVSWQHLQQPCVPGKV